MNFKWAVKCWIVYSLNAVSSSTEDLASLLMIGRKFGRKSVRTVLIAKFNIPSQEYHNTS